MEFTLIFIFDPSLEYVILQDLKINFNSGVILNTFYGVLKEGITFKQIKDEILGWFPVKDTYKVTDDLFAGEGNVQYFINASVQDYRINEGG